MQMPSDNGESNQAQTDHRASVDTHDDSSAAETVRLPNLKDCMINYNITHDASVIMHCM